MTLPSSRRMGSPLGRVWTCCSLESRERPWRSRPACRGASRSARCTTGLPAHRPLPPHLASRLEVFVVLLRHQPVTQQGLIRGQRSVRRIGVGNAKGGVELGHIGEDIRKKHGHQIHSNLFAEPSGRPKGFPRAIHTILKSSTMLPHPSPISSRTMDSLHPTDPATGVLELESTKDFDSTPSRIQTINDEIAKKSQFIDLLRSEIGRAIIGQKI